MKNSNFRFKQFSIEQSNSAMKIGTDGVLLGAWSPIAQYSISVLDIGAGTGLIALIEKQKPAFVHQPLEDWQKTNK